jgi:hypothetical protein
MEKGHEIWCLKCKVSRPGSGNQDSWGGGGELAGCKLDLMGVREVRWEGEGYQTADNYGLCGRCSNGVPPIHFFQAEHIIQFRSRSMRFLGFSNHEKGAPR